MTKDYSYPVPCSECGTIVQLTGRYASRAKSTICEKCDPNSPYNRPDLFPTAETKPMTDSPIKKYRNKALLIVGGLIAIQWTYTIAIDPFVKQANYFNQCVELQREAEAGDDGVPPYYAVQSVHVCNGGERSFRAK